MRHRIRGTIVVIAAIALTGLYWGCDRMSGEVDSNQLPEVYFVNVPLDSSVFSFAPVVRWFGHDPDGMVVAYQYHDDSTEAAVAAYQAGDAALRAYVAALPENAWRTTYQSSDTIYLRRSENDSITQHVFMIRCIDDLGGISPVKVRTFFRTNNAPNAPKVKWVLDPYVRDENGTRKPIDYTTDYQIPDTLFWADTTTLTYGGIGFLWQGTDPDSRELNIIPLTFSWALVCDRPNGSVDTLPHPVYDDSNRVSGFASGWSPWTSSTQVTIAGWFADSAWCMANRGAPFELDGSYRFLVRVRDDGLTESDTIAVARFRAVRPLYDDPVEGKQLLVVDWSRVAHPTVERGGALPKQQILDFYNALLPEGFELAEAIRTQAYPDMIPGPLVYNTDQVQWFSSPVLVNLQRTPYDYIRRFKWVWVICDNPPNTPPGDMWRTVNPQLKVFMDYLDVGGQIMFSGRKLFYGVFNLSYDGATLNPGIDNIADNFLRDYCGLSNVTSKKSYPNCIADFAGATTTNMFLPQLEVDTAIVHSVKYAGGVQFYALPEVDYFARSSGRSGYDYSTTVYNYQSSTASESYEATNVDCEVISSTPTWAILRPARDSDQILSVSRVYNRTRDVYGEVIQVWQVNRQWRIRVSTPFEAGAWETADVLEVDYTYIPIAPSHDEPVATNFSRVEGVLTINYNTGTFTFQGLTRFRSAFFAFPMVFMKNDYLVTVPLFGSYHPMAYVLASQIIIFNSPRVIDFGQGYGGALP